MWNDGGASQGGGGFDQGGGYVNSPSNARSSGAKGGNRGYSLPCTTSQVLTAKPEDDKWVVHNTELNQVSLLGLVRSIRETPTRIDYEVDDMTGPAIEVKQFVDGDKPIETIIGDIRENSYVRINGHLRSFNGNRNVVAFSIKPVTDMNEITCHLAEVATGNLLLVKSQKEEVGGSNVTMSSAPMHDSNSGLVGIQRQVDDIIKKNISDQGISVQEIQLQLRGIPSKQISDAIEFLSTEGHIYSTIDDDHYKSTEA